jgi:hypothetical protein
MFLQNVGYHMASQPRITHHFFSYENVKFLSTCYLNFSTFDIRFRFGQDFPVSVTEQL